MAKYGMLIVIAVALAACSGHSQNNGSIDTVVKKDVIVKVRDTLSTVEQADLIIPGKSIGTTTVGGNLDSVVNTLGKPDKQDAAMGSVLMTWYDKHDTTGYAISIFANRNQGNKDENVAHIRKILVNSTIFKTKEGIGTGSTMELVTKYYHLKKGNGYTANGKQINLYSDIDKGISFETDPTTNKCVGILVYKAGDSPVTYINMH